MGDEDVEKHQNSVVPDAICSVPRGMTESAILEPAVQTPSEEEQSDIAKQGNAGIIVLVSFLAIISPLSSSIYFPALTSIADDLNVSISLVNLTITTYLIFQGIAPSFIGNFSDTYGRRPAYMICCIIFLAANIGLALQNSYAALLVLRCLQSCGSSATIALGSATAADMVTRAERGKYMGYAAMGVTLGPALGPVIGGLLDEYLGWRSIFWFLTILSGALFLVIFIFLPETCRSVVGNGSISPPWWNMSLIGYLKQRRQGDVRAEPEMLSRRRPNPFTTLKILAEKEAGIILGFSSLMYGGYYLVVATLSTQLTDRFRCSSVIVGVCYLPIGIGSISYRYTGGYLMDWNFRRHAKKAGIEIAKNRQQDLSALPIERMRVEISLPCVYLSCAMIMVYGWIMDQNLSLAGIEVSLFFCAVVFSASLNNLNTLIVDLHVSSPATAVAANNLARCLVGAGAAAIATPMIDRLGLGWTSILVAGVWTLLSPLLWLVMLKGEKWREGVRNQRGSEALRA
ncbi:major facilitator superfamily domain-containing protein [Thelonectria olida]|uniref:Major facilitator superfamily domain-containing protein n=1 Tax=Thelonectria olida TaxID=1576542 RepID=A0A9P9AF43_9HYPO|nr:major facilitator superfamily domain-containing protein [Thelonectria olida]